MIKKNKWQLIISSVIILLPIVVGLLIWNYLPDQIGTHWNVKGELDGWNGRVMIIFGLPIFLFVTHWISIIFTTLDPKNKNQSSKVIKMGLWIMPITSLIVCSYIYVIALGNDLRIDSMVRVLLGLMFIILGNYMPKCKQNNTIGVKVTWALRNEENWYKTHRFTGRLWVIGGIFFLATIFLPMKLFINIFIPFILTIAFVPIIYSYTYYRKQLKVGTATKEASKMTTLEKRLTKISLAIGFTALAIVAVFLFTGNFEIHFNETSFTVKANYWEDVTVKYADIDNIEYREQNSAGTRIFGYGTPFLTMGECENVEFGNYSQYAYSSSDSYVVLTINQKTLVLNGKDEKQTKVIYDNLVEKINGRGK